jgi:hypothetical protein
VTTGPLARFFMQQPFEPFTLVLVDGRELHVHHIEFAMVNRDDRVVTFLHPSGQVEIVDFDLITSIRTIYPADIADFQSPRDSE